MTEGEGEKQEEKQLFKLGGSGPESDSRTPTVQVRRRARSTNMADYKETQTGRIQAEAVTSCPFGLPRARGHRLARTNPP